MNRDKQIEKMANDLYTCHDEYPRDGYDWVTDYNSTAKRLYEKGYRKASEVAREIFEEIDELAYLFMNNRDYIFSDMVYDLAELKKKYTENEG